MADAASTQKVYARGYFDALRDYGHSMESVMAMKRSKFNSIHSGLSTIIQKVYSVIPIEQAWDLNQIHGELYRLGMAPDFRSTASCCSTLVKSGLITEPTTGTFKKVPIQAMETTTTPKSPKDVPMQTENKPKAGAESPLSLGLIDLSAKALAISEAMVALSQDIDKVNIELAEKSITHDAETSKLRQLQQLLKELG